MRNFPGRHRLDTSAPGRDETLHCLKHQVSGRDGPCCSIRDVPGGARHVIMSGLQQDTGITSRCETPASTEYGCVLTWEPRYRREKQMVAWYGGTGAPYRGRSMSTPDQRVHLPPLASASVFCLRIRRRADLVLQKATATRRSGRTAKLGLGLLDNHDTQQKSHSLLFQGPSTVALRGSRMGALVRANAHQNGVHSRLLYLPYLRVFTYGKYPWVHVC